jgi:putative ABC transport system permease protein
MFKNHLKLAIRNLWKKKIYSFINMTGLALAAAFAILVFLYAGQENNYDRFHAKGKNLYRLELTNLFNFDGSEAKKSFFSFLYKDNQARNMLRLPASFPGELKNNFPEIKNYTRLKVWPEMVIRLNNQSFKVTDKSVAFAEQNFFSVFSFPLLKGNRQTVLAQPDGLVISERAAKKYFGDENPIGKIINLKLRVDRPFVVTGIAKDFPAGSSMQFDMILPLEADPGYKKNMADGNNQYSHLAILELQDQVNGADFEKKVNIFSKNYFAATVKDFESYSKDKKKIDFQAYLRPFADAHFNASDGWFHYTNLERIYQLLALTLIILFIVCINYVLLTLSSTAARSHEVGIRKTIGAARSQIVSQFWMETQLLVIVSVATAYILAVVTLPFFNQLIGAELKIQNVPGWLVVALLVGLSIGLGFLAGIYPALAMSGLRPLKIMRGHATYKLNPRLSRAFIVLQYATCIVLVIASVVIARQMKYMLNKDLGFDKEQVVLIEAPDRFADGQAMTVKNRFYQFAASEPGIEKVTASTFTFAEGFNMNGHIIDGRQEFITEMNIDYGYFDFNKIPIIKGRAFATDMPTDTAEFDIPAALYDSSSSSTNKAIVVNETLYNMLGKPPLDQINRPMGSRIIGVCKDYHFWGLTQKVGSAYHLCSPGTSAYYWCKIRPNQNVPELLDRIRTNWNAITGNAPFAYSFMDETVQRFYESHQKWLQTVSFFSWLAIIVACLGFFGLSGLNAVNRTKEIGIRKIMGATVSRILLLLNKEFILLVAVALLIAVPVAGYLVYEWLENFAYRIKVDWTVYIIGAGIAMTSAALAVSYHTIKAAISNPVNALRNE